MGGYKLFTASGNDFFEASGAMQKAVRRGLEDDAMYWAVDLINAGYDNYVWKRLKIITSEDVGLAEPQMPAVINSLFDTYMELKKKKDTKHFPERLFITHAILLLCRAKKSRMVDWFLIKHFKGHEQLKREIPDYALDMHNRRGKALGRGIDHFVEEGGKLNNHHPVEGEQETMDVAVELIKNPDVSIKVNDEGSFEMEI